MFQPVKIPVGTGGLTIGNDNKSLLSVDDAHRGVDLSVQFIQLASAKERSSW